MVDNSVLIEDDKKYLVVDTIISDDVKYVYFMNDEDETDLFIRKEIIDNNQKYLVGLDNDEEFLKANKIFQEKHKS